MTKRRGLSWGAEKNMVSMIADISRVREGDDILFYLRRGENEGRFYGVFRAVGSPFYDANEHNYLADLLGRTLNLRVCIEPARVYAKGVTEHKVLDSLDGVSHPCQLFWSLIYRKLKGNRGCTMLTDNEADRLVGKNRGRKWRRGFVGNRFYIRRAEREHRAFVRAQDLRRFAGRLVHRKKAGVQAAAKAGVRDPSSGLPAPEHMAGRPVRPAGNRPGAASLAGQRGAVAASVCSGWTS